MVLEIGGGLGVLSEYLAPRCAHVHVVEVDQALQPALAEALAPFRNATLHIGDFMDLDLAALDPSPGKMVANLPYGIAAGAILRTIGVLDGMTRWVAMIQREVGERFAAAPGSRDYGAVSVLAQLSCDVRVLRPVSRRVFYPVPNVDSVLLLLVRHAGDGASHELRVLVRNAFAHRRKALAGSLALARNAAPGIRDRTREALVALGYPADVRAERLSPADFVALHEALAS
jgi:16S rRNA (adenine1518-N6/adenine1519-N6)-dimethyltransferase